MDFTFQEIDSSQAATDYQEFGIEPDSTDEDGLWSFFVGHPWERQPRETDQAWSAFSIYVNMDIARRSVVGSYRISKGWESDARATAPRVWQGWYKKNRWKERALRWDQYRNQTAVQAELKAIEDQAVNRVRNYGMLMSVAATIVSKADLTNLSAKDARMLLAMVTTFVDVGAKGQRVELGQPATSVDVNVRNDENPQRISVEKLESIVSKGMAGGLRFDLPPGG